LGSPRIITDENGQVTSRRDFLPFGEEIESGTGGRNSAQGYFGVDSIRQKFTSYERDAETDLDFAQARMYHKNHGRFTSVDPIFIKEDRLRDPQQINLYAYVRNNPLSLTDPTGLDFEFRGKDKDKFVDDINNRDKAQFKIKLTDKGIVEIVDKDKVDVSKLSKTEKAMFDAINDTEHRGILVGIDAQPGIDFGGFLGKPYVLASNGAGINLIDTSDVSLLRDADKTAAGEVMSHEMMEAYASATSGSLDYDTVHKEASKLFPEPTFTETNSLPNEKGKSTMTGYTAVWTWTRPDKDISVRVTYTFVTPIPRASITSQPQGNMTKIEVVKKK
jgi:RHS repeat-associated protein